MSTVRYYRHDDPGAPQLTGQVGSLTNVLRKCLVGTAGVAYGSKPSAGWTEQFVGAAANIAAFKNNEAEGGCGCLVRVLDDGSGAGGARESTINIYAAMTDINTGALGSVGTYFRKSATLDSIARPWFVVADGRTAWVQSYLIGDPSQYSMDCSLSGFGDLLSVLSAGNSNRYFIIGRRTANSTSGGNIDAFACGPISPTSSFQAAAPAGSGMNPARWSLTKESAGFNGWGTRNFPKSTSSLAPLAKGCLVSSGGAILGSLRGVLLPAADLEFAAPGSLLEPSSIVVASGNADNGGADWGFRIGLETVGPW